MQKLITYLKQGKGRGLLAMLIFSTLVSLLSWAGYHSSLNEILTKNPDLNMIWLHIGLLLASFLFIWLFYLIVVGISAFFSWIFRLKLPKGAIWRSASFSIIMFVLVSTLTSLIEAGLLFALGPVLPFPGSPEYMIIVPILSPLLFMIIFFILLVILVAFSISEPKENKKKK